MAAIRLIGLGLVLILQSCGHVERQDISPKKTHQSVHRTPSVNEQNDETPTLKDLKGFLYPPRR